MKYYLDNFEISEPSGFIGATFERATHEKYYGYWGGIGLNVGASGGKIKFTEDKAVKYIKKQVAKYGTKTKVTFKVVDECSKSACNNIEYQIDISDYTEVNCCEIDLSFKPVEGQDIRAKMETKYEVIPTESLTIQKIDNSNITIKGIYLKDAYQQIIAKIGNGSTFKSNWLNSCNNIFLSNGENIKNQINKPFTLSLDMLFDGINPSENIEYSIIDNEFRVERKFKRCDSYTTIKGGFESVSKTINSNMLYNNISIGYKEWKGEPAFDLQAYNSVRNYTTGYIQGSKKLDLLSEFITSQQVVDKSLNSNETSFNEKIFMFWKGETTNGNYNKHFTPARMLERHLNYLSLSGDIAYTSGEGNVTYSHTDNDVCDGPFDIIENQSFNNYTGELIESLFTYEFETVFTIEQFCRLKKCVRFEYCGEMIIAKIKKAMFKIGDNGINTISIVCG